ncbi:MAG: A24 family peptidase [Candidatus Diapherotrites archaeon]
MDLLLIRQICILIASGIGAWTDYKTGLINDWITYPLIALGILLNLIEWNLTGIGFGLLVFVIGFIAYYSGKLGGGDVKLFAGMALMLPFFEGKIFVLSALFFGSIASVLFYGIYFPLKYFRKGIDFELNKKRIQMSLLLFVFLIIYFWFMNSFRIIPIGLLALIFVAVLIGLIFFALEKGIRKEFFLKKVKVAELEEDEVIVLDEELIESIKNKQKKGIGEKSEKEKLNKEEKEFEKNKKLKEILSLKFKGVIGEKEKQKLLDAGIQEVFVYRDLPKFGPFIFIGTVLAMVLPPMVLGGLI